MRPRPCPAYTQLGLPLVPLSPPCRALSLLCPHHHPAAPSPCCAPIAALLRPLPAVRSCRPAQPALPRPPCWAQFFVKGPTGMLGGILPAVRSHCLPHQCPSAPSLLLRAVLPEGPDGHAGRHPVCLKPGVGAGLLRQAVAPVCRLHERHRWGFTCAGVQMCALVSLQTACAVQVGWWVQQQRWREGRAVFAGCLDDMGRRGGRAGGARPGAACLPRALARNCLSSCPSSPTPCPISPTPCPHPQPHPCPSPCPTPTPAPPPLPHTPLPWVPPGLALELASPLLPGAFLLLACLGSVARAVRGQGAPAGVKRTVLSAGARAERRASWVGAPAGGGASTTPQAARALAASPALCRSPPEPCAAAQRRRRHPRGPRPARLPALLPPLAPPLLRRSRGWRAAPPAWPSRSTLRSGATRQTWRPRRGRR